MFPPVHGISHIAVLPGILPGDVSCLLLHKSIILFGDHCQSETFEGRIYRISKILRRKDAYNIPIKSAAGKCHSYCIEDKKCVKGKKRIEICWEEETK